MTISILSWLASSAIRKKELNILITTLTEMKFEQSYEHDSLI